MLNIYIAYETNPWSFTVGKDFAFTTFLFGAVKLTKNDGFDKYKYSRYGTGFDEHRSFSLSDGGGFSKNVITFGVDMSSSSVHIDGQKKDILILVKVQTNGLDDTILAAENEYFINFTKQHKKFCLGLQYDGVSRYIFVKGFDICKFKTKDY